MAEKKSIKKNKFEIYQELSVDLDAINRNTAFGLGEVTPEGYWESSGLTNVAYSKAFKSLEELDVEGLDKKINDKEKKIAQSLFLELHAERESANRFLSAGVDYSTFVEAERVSPTTEVKKPSKSDKTQYLRGLLYDKYFGDLSICYRDANGILKIKPEHYYKDSKGKSRVKPYIEEALVERVRLYKANLTRISKLNDILRSKLLKNEKYINYVESLGKTKGKGKDRKLARAVAKSKKQIKKAKKKPSRFKAWFTKTFRRNDVLAVINGQAPPSSDQMAAAIALLSSGITTYEKQQEKVPEQKQEPKKQTPGNYEQVKDVEAQEQTQEQTQKKYEKVAVPVDLSAFKSDAEYNAFADREARRRAEEMGFGSDEATIKFLREKLDEAREKGETITVVEYKEVKDTPVVMDQENVKEKENTQPTEQPVKKDPEEVEQKEEKAEETSVPPVQHVEEVPKFNATTETKVEYIPEDPEVLRARELKEKWTKVPEGKTVEGIKAYWSNPNFNAEDPYPFGDSTKTQEVEQKVQPAQSFNYNQYEYQRPLYYQPVTPAPKFEAASTTPQGQPVHQEVNDTVVPKPEELATDRKLEELKETWGKTNESIEELKKIWGTPEQSIDPLQESIAEHVRNINPITIDPLFAAAHQGQPAVTPTPPSPQNAQKVVAEQSEKKPEKTPTTPVTQVGKVGTPANQSTVTPTPQPEQVVQTSQSTVEFEYDPYNGTPINEQVFTEEKTKTEEISREEVEKLVKQNKKEFVGFKKDYKSAVGKKNIPGKTSKDKEKYIQDEFVKYLKDKEKQARKEAQAAILQEAIDTRVHKINPVQGMEMDPLFKASHPAKPTVVIGEEISKKPQPKVEPKPEQQKSFKIQGIEKYQEEAKNKKETMEFVAANQREYKKFKKEYLKMNKGKSKDVLSEETIMDTFARRNRRPEQRIVTEGVNPESTNSVLGVVNNPDHTRVLNDDESKLFRHGGNVVEDITINKPTIKEVNVSKMSETEFNAFVESREQAILNDLMSKVDRNQQSEAIAVAEGEAIKKFEEQRAVLRTTLEKARAEGRTVKVHEVEKQTVRFTTGLEEKTDFTNVKEERKLKKVTVNVDVASMSEAEFNAFVKEREQAFMEQLDEDVRRDQHNLDSVGMELAEKARKAEDQLKLLRENLEKLRKEGKPAPVIKYMYPEEIEEMERKAQEQKGIHSGATINVEYNDVQKDQYGVYSNANEYVLSGETQNLYNSSNLEQATLDSQKGKASAEYKVSAEQQRILQTLVELEREDEELREEFDKQNPKPQEKQKLQSGDNNVNTSDEKEKENSTQNPPSGIADLACDAMWKDIYNSLSVKDNEGKYKYKIAKDVLEFGLLECASGQKESLNAAERTRAIGDLKNTYSNDILIDINGLANDKLKKLASQKTVERIAEEHNVEVEKLEDATKIFAGIKLKEKIGIRDDGTFVTWTDEGDINNPIKLDPKKLAEIEGKYNVKLSELWKLSLENPKNAERIKNELADNLKNMTEDHRKKAQEDAVREIAEDYGVIDKITIKNGNLLGAEALSDVIAKLRVEGIMSVGLTDKGLSRLALYELSQVKYNEKQGKMFADDGVTLIENDSRKSDFYRALCDCGIEFDIRQYEKFIRSKVEGSVKVYEEATKAGKVIKTIQTENGEKEVIVVEKNGTEIYISQDNPPRIIETDEIKQGNNPLVDINEVVDAISEYRQNLYGPRRAPRAELNVLREIPKQMYPKSDEGMSM